MRPQSFRPQMPPIRPYNQFQGPPRGFYGPRPPRFPQPGMMPPPTQGRIPGMGAAGAAGAGGLSPKIQSFMDTANRFLATAQGFQPLVQQATPMFRNLPALWRIYKGFQGLPKNEDSKGHGEHEPFDFDESSDFLEDFDQSERAERRESLEKQESFARPERRPVRSERFAKPPRPVRSGRRERQDFDLSESPTYNEKTIPKKATTRPSMPRIFQPPFQFDE